mgnify:CR=1 FL=1
MIKKEKITKDNVVKFPSKLTDLEKEIEAVIFAAAEPLDVDTIESKISKKANVKRFFYASSSSVYGIKDEPNVHEEMELEPLTDYSIFKADCEKILAEYQSDDFTTTTIRPATVCGYSPRQRLDVVVNILTNLAYHKREISIFGGDQLRPNIHIKDMVRAYQTVMESPKDIVNKENFKNIEDIREYNSSVVKLSKKYGCLVHCDAAQALGKIKIDLEKNLKILVNEL